MVETTSNRIWPTTSLAARHQQCSYIRGLLFWCKGTMVGEKRREGQPVVMADPTLALPSLPRTLHPCPLAALCSVHRRPDYHPSRSSGCISSSSVVVLLALSLRSSLHRLLNGEWAHFWPSSSTIRASQGVPPPSHRPSSASPRARRSLARPTACTCVHHCDCLV